MVRAACVLVLVIVVSSSAFCEESAVGPDQFRVRCMSKQVRGLVMEGLRISPTFRGLMSRIADSDLIVFVRLGDVKPGSVGATQLIASRAGNRFVLVTIKTGVPTLDLLARLGHELRHVTEVADAPDVQDDQGMRRLFARIGWAAGYDSWETDAAVELGRRVLYESYARPRETTRLARAR